MTTKNYGPGVSGYRDPGGRAWETTVYQAAKPVLDSELNLVQDADQSMMGRIRQRSLPSGWFADDITETSDMSTAIFSSSAVANQLLLPYELRAHVNGWFISVNLTNGTTNNLDLGAGPAGAGAKRIDLVVLEVWRRLISASPSTTGKSPSGRIWFQGNVKIANADDLTTNFVDDLLDTNVGSETTKRVQIQYRLRVIPGVDILTFPFGIDDPVVVARSVPPNAATPDGSATAFTYANQSAVGDAGLWQAGDGNPSNSLGTVDGYMYAIPLMAVVRRNTTAFARNTNHNGGVASPGPSDRPDGLFHDIVAAQDIIDLRLAVSPSGWNYEELLRKNYNWLLDNVLQTELTQTTIGGGVQGHTHLWADEIGITNAHGGDGVTTGDTPGAEFVGEFDAVRRRFSDRTIIETMVVKYTPSGPNWTNNESITIDPGSLPVYPYAAFNWLSFAPSAVAFIDMVDAYFIGNGGSKKLAAIGTNFTLANMGAVPAGSMTLKIGTVPGGVTNEPLYVKLAVMYPTGQGLTKTPVADFGTASISVNNPGSLPAGAPILFDVIKDRALDYPHRELFLTYRALNQTISFSYGVADTIIFPERVDSISAIVINSVSYGGTITISDDGYSATLDPGSFTTGEATVTFKAVRPFPQNGEQITVYYNARAPQTIRDALLSVGVAVVPRHVAQQLNVLTVGSGSQDEAYPFPFQYVQQPGVYPTSGGTFSGDHEFEGNGVIQLDGFSFNTGYMQLPVTIGYVPNPEGMSFQRVGDIDAEGRSFFKSFPVDTYAPNAFAQPLKIGPKTRRVLLPVLAELPVGLPFGQKGQLVLAVLGAFYEASGAETLDNSIAFNADLTLNVASMSLYKIKGNPLNRRSF